MTHEHPVRLTLETKVLGIFAGALLFLSILDLGAYQSAVVIALGTFFAFGLVPLAGILIRRDLVERTRVEAQLKQAKDAAHASSRAQGELLANLSHEIRTPVKGIIGMTEHALGLDGLPAQARSHLETVRTSAGALLTVIGDILDFSMIQAGTLDLERVHFDLREHLGEAVKSLAPSAHAAGLELAFAVHPEAPDALVGDPRRLRQVVQNLVGNAIKFTEEGEVVVRVRPVSRSDETTELEWSVTDTGIGIPAEKHESIFRPFEQALPAGSRTSGGTGLGLAICSHLVGMMGGRIWVESDGDHGSVFRFTARLGLQPAETVRPARPAPPALRNLPVLVVDDNATGRGILEETLRGWHARPTAAANADAALAFLHQARETGTPCRLVFLDADLQGIDGFRVAEQIIHSPALADTVIMLLTADDQAAGVARCRTLGLPGYLVKPVAQAELLNAIRTVLGASAPANARPTRPGQSGASDGTAMLERLEA